jgi:hypothetical protein
MQQLRENFGLDCQAVHIDKYEVTRFEDTVSFSLPFYPMNYSVCAYINEYLERMVMIKGSIESTYCWYINDTGVKE